MTSSVYTLGTGPVSLETSRLDTQHPFFRKLTGGLLPRSISDSLSSLPSPRIADIGTGTGIWLQDLASQLPPTSELHGFDIDTEKFPSPDTLSTNLTFTCGNALEPFPEDHLETYDLVHLRLLKYGLKKDEWEPAARNVATLLKPGGWLLWEEAGYSSWVSIPPSPAISTIIALDIQLARKLGRDITHPAKLLAHVESSGLVDCVDRDYLSFELMAAEGWQPLLKVWTGALKGILAQGGLPGLNTEEDINKLHQRAEEDLVSGRIEAGLQMKRVWGRKR